MKRPMEDAMKKAAVNVRALVRQTLGHTGETNGCACTRLANTLIVIMMSRMVMMIILTFGKQK